MYGIDRSSLLSAGLVLLLAAWDLGVAADPPSLTSDELVERAIHRRAVEAVIWGMPAVNFDCMLQAAIANGAEPNQVVYWSRPVNWKDQTLTPNPDTIYLHAFYDTRNGPLVLEIPAADGDLTITGSVDNAWQNALGDLGPAGLDLGTGGKYLITPPAYENQAPTGYFVLPSDTYQGLVILRSNYRSGSDADIAAAVDYGKRIRLYPLGGSPDETAFVDVYDKLFDATIPYDARYFESLHRFVQVEPWLTRDKVMIDLLQSIGIVKGRPFEPDAKTRAILGEAAREARTYLDAQYEAILAEPFHAGAHWSVPGRPEVIEGMSSGFAAPDSYPIDGRGAAYSMGYFSVKHLGTGQFYLMTIKDGAGERLTGDRTYRLHVPPDAPVKLYWSATAYDRETHALIRETSRSSRASNSAGVDTNPDGSVDLYFGPRPPDGKESNWVPTNDRDFEVLFRLYGPEQAVFDKTWTLPDLEEVH